MTTKLNKNRPKPQRWQRHDDSWKQIEHKDNSICLSMCTGIQVAYFEVILKERYKGKVSQKDQFSAPSSQ